MIANDDGGAALFQTHHEDPDLNILDIVMLEMEAMDNLPDVDADSDRIFQLFDNLVSNALRCTPEGRVIQLSA